MIGCPRYIFKNENFNHFKHLKWIHAGSAGIEQYISDKFRKSKIILLMARLYKGLR